MKSRLKTLSSVVCQWNLQSIDEIALKYYSPEIDISEFNVLFCAIGDISIFLTDSETSNKTKLNCGLNGEISY